MPAPKGNTNAAKDGEKRNQPIVIRAKPADLLLIDTAAEILGQSRSKFMIESALIASGKLLREE